MLLFRIRLILLFLYFILEISTAYSEVLQVDSNFDGEMDQWHHMSDNNKVIKIEYDNNGDSKIDQTDIYEKNKTPLRAKIDRNFDGNIDQVQYLLENTHFNYAVYGSMWKSDIIPSGGLGKVDVGVAILSRWPLSEAERIQLPLREDQKFYEKYFYLRRCMVKAKLEIPGWDDLYAVDIHAASFSTDDTKQKHIIKYKNVLDLTALDFHFVTGGDLNAIPPEADSLDYCMEDQCRQDEYTWHTSNDPKHYHRKGSYYNNFEAMGEYPSEPDLLTIIYDQYNSGITNDINDISNFTYGARNDDNPDKEYFVNNSILFLK